MIVSKDTNPGRDIYYLGAKVIDIMSAFKSKQVDFFEVYQRLNREESVSISLYSLTLAWLYVAGAVTNAPNGTIEKCF